MEAGPGRSALVLLPSSGLMRDVAERENTFRCMVKPDVDLTICGVGQSSPSAWLPRLLLMF